MLAMAVVQPTEILTVLASSLAGQLPQVCVVAQDWR